MNEKKYLAIDIPKGGFCGDEYISVFDSAEEATAEAERIWNHFVKSEKKKRYVYSCCVTKSDLLKGAINDDGNIDWGFNSGGHDYDGCFDSERF